ncbi:MAG: pilus assembly protein PilP [Desulfobacterales bacterium]|nr:pilus assembly protein PilP [Desulfobacterales bacterium]
MSKRTLFIAALFFLLSPWFLMGLGSSPGEPEKDVHVSEEVKIEQEQAQEDQAASAETEEQEKSREKTSRAQAAQASEPEKQAKSGEGQQLQDTDDSKRSAEQELREMTLSGDESLMADEQRLYTRKGRVDPFEPFLNKGPESNGEGGEEDANLPSPPDTPLTRVSLSQLKLTAILQIPGEKKSIAMVEDPGGKGYVINKGTYVGESGGKVSEILSDRILIREKYKDVYGKIAVREIEKKLQK